MKKLRSLSVKNPDALNRRNWRSAWGGFFWVGVNRRKQAEAQVRAARAALRIYAAVQARMAEAAQDAPLPGEQAIDDTATPVRH